MSDSAFSSGAGSANTGETNAIETRMQLAVMIVADISPLDMSDICWSLGYCELVSYLITVVSLSHVILP